MRSIHLSVTILWLILGSGRGEVGGRCIYQSPNPLKEKKINDEQLIRLIVKCRLGELAYDESAVYIEYEIFMISQG